MADLSISAHVTRANLTSPLADLSLNDDINYTFGKQLNVGRVAWRKETVTSPFIHGRVVVGEVMDAAEGSCVVYVHGGTHSALKTNLDTLLNAFTEQYEYVLKLMVEGQYYYWRCERADYEVGFMTETLKARHVPVMLSFFRRPIPDQGPF